MIDIYNYENNKKIYKLNDEYFDFISNKKINVDINKLKIFLNSKKLIANLNNTFSNEICDLKKKLKNKSVAIVGPSPYLEGKKLGKYIDSFDYIIRINKGYKLVENKEDYGSRTDILYHVINQHPENGGPINNDLLKKYNIKYLVGCYPIIDYDENTSFDNIGTIRDYFSLEKNINNFYKIYKKKYINFEKSIGTRPNAGTICIWDILESPVKKIYITGFSLFKGGYSKIYRDVIDGNTNTEEAVLERIKKNHDQEKIKTYYKKVLLNNPKIELNKEISDILNNN